jgi:hypothetical protein
VLVLTWSIGRAAEADDKRPSIAVVPVHVQGELATEARARLEQRLVDGLERGSLAVSDSARTSEKAPSAAGCRSAECVADLTRKAGVEFAVITTVTVDGRDYRVSMEIFNASGKSVAQVSEACRVCGLEEVGELVSDEAATLSAKIGSLVRGPPVIVVRSEPPGARVRVDGKLAGTTPATLELAPGKHTLRLGKPGFIAQERKLEMVAGVREEISVRLQVEPDTNAVLLLKSAPTGAEVHVDGELAGTTPLEYPVKPGRHKVRVALVGYRGETREVVVVPDEREQVGFNLAPAGRAATIWGAVSTGTGLASLGAGIALLAINGREDTSDCSGDNVDIDGDCKYRYETLPGGIAATAVGAVLTGVGVGLLIHGRKRARRARASVGPGTLQVAVRF